MPKLSVIIVSYNVRLLLFDCLESIAETCRELDPEVIVVENASTDGIADVLRSTYERIKVIANSENIGFAIANNQGYAVSSGEYLLLLNPDTVLKPGAVRNVLDFMVLTPDAGIAACRLANPDGSLQKSIKYFPSVVNNLLIAFCLDKLFHPGEWRKSYYRNQPFAVDYLSGAFMMVRRKTLEGEKYLLNPDFFMYSEEKDLALRLKERGWKCYFVPGAEIIHYGGQSTKQMPEEMFIELQRSQVKYFYAHHGRLKAGLLDATWWLVLFFAWLRSIPISMARRDFKKTRMISAALRQYPKFARPEAI